MGFEAWVTISVLLSILALLATTNVAADFAMLGGLTLLMIVGIVSPREALAGMAETARITVGGALSFAPILGGLTTKIGTSTNVIVSGLMLTQLGRPMEMFELASIGVPAALAGIGPMRRPGRVLPP